MNLNKQKDTNIALLTDSHEKTINNLYSKFGLSRSFRESSQSNSTYFINSNKITKLQSTKKLTNLSNQILLTQSLEKISRNSTLEGNEILYHIKKKNLRKTLMFQEMIKSKSILNISKPSYVPNDKNVISISKFPSNIGIVKKPKETFKNIYKSFNEMSKIYKNLSSKLGKSLEEIDKTSYQIKNKEKIKDNNMLGVIVKNKDINIDSRKKNMGELSKDDVLKQYNLINLTKDEHAEDIIKKNRLIEYKPKNNIKLKINHTKLINLINNIKIKKK